MLAVTLRPHNECWQGTQVWKERLHSPGPGLLWPACGVYWGWLTPEDSPVCHHCLEGMPTLSAVRGQAAGEEGNLLLGDILSQGLASCDVAFSVDAV